MKISVITAVYESEKTVGEAIASVATQTHHELEHLIVEGNSSDKSLDAINRAAHERMLLVSEPDEGIYDALNKGIRRSTGDVIGFVHSDDFLAHEQALSRIATAFENPAVEAVFSDLDYVSQSNPSRVVRHWSTGTFHPKQLKYGWMPAHPTLYVRRKIYERFGLYNKNMGISADYDFILRYFSQINGKSVYIPEVLYKMRLGGASNRSLSRILRKMNEDYLAIQQNHVGGISTLAMKNLSKIGQFLARKKHAEKNVV